MAVTPIFSYTPQNATLIAGMLVGTPVHGHRGMVLLRLAILVIQVHL